MDQYLTFRLHYLARIRDGQIARRNGEAVKYAAILLVGATALRHTDALPEPWRITTQIALGLACATHVFLLGVVMQHLAVPYEHGSLVRQIQREEARSTFHFMLFRCAAVAVVLGFLVVAGMRSVGH